MQELMENHDKLKRSATPRSIIMDPNLKLSRHIIVGLIGHVVQNTLREGLISGMG